MRLNKEREVTTQSLNADGMNSKLTPQEEQKATRQVQRTRGAATVLQTTGLLELLYTSLQK